MGCNQSVTNRVTVQRASSYPLGYVLGFVLEVCRGQARYERICQFRIPHKYLLKKGHQPSHCQLALRNSRDNIKI